jgi:hypothetical protein
MIAKMITRDPLANSLNRPTTTKKRDPLAALTTAELLAMKTPTVLTTKRDLPAVMTAELLAMKTPMVLTTTRDLPAVMMTTMRMIRRDSLVDSPSRPTITKRRNLAAVMTADLLAVMKTPTTKMRMTADLPAVMMRMMRMTADLPAVMMRMMRMTADLPAVMTADLLAVMLTRLRL